MKNVPDAVEELEKCRQNLASHEDRLRAWAFVDEARAEVEARRVNGLSSAPLKGVIVGIKDIIDVADMPTGCGSQRWQHSIARTDACLVRKLREAGAVILGKTATTPYAYLDPAPTRNPWQLDRTPGGSSAGSAAAVAAGMCTVAIGSQTGGSTIRPASYCGVASLKPTYGAISVDGVLPLAPSLDHIGIMAQTVAELAAVFQVIAGPDGTASSSLLTHKKPRRIPDCLSFIAAHQDNPARPLTRLGGLFEERADPELLRHYDNALSRLESASGRIKRVVPPVGFLQIHQHHLTVMSSEAARVHGSRFDRSPEDYPPKITELIQQGRQRTGPELSAALAAQTALRSEMEQLLSDAGVVVTPATPDFPPSRETTGNPAFNSPWSFLGFPVASVPAGWSDSGLPFALQFIGAPGAEAELLAVAAWAESVLRFERRSLPC